MHNGNLSALRIYLSLELRVQAVSVYLLTVDARDRSEKTTYTVKSKTRNELASTSKAGQSEGALFMTF